MMRSGKQTLVVGALLCTLGLPAVGQETVQAEESRAARTERLERTFRAVRTLLREGRRERFAPEAVVDLCDGQAEQAFTWVRDHTAWVDYEGVLRGPGGVLMDRVGNSLDRALLLAELCRLCGEEVRLARAELAPEVLEDLSARVRPLVELTDRFETAGEDDASTGESLEEWATRMRLPVRAVTTAAAASRLESERAAAAAGERIATATVALTEVMGGRVPAPMAKTTGILGDSPLEHAWVQVRRGDSWIDLDPLTLDAEWGQALVAATSTVRVDQLEDDAYHQITLRVVAEQWTEQGRAEHVLVERRWRAADTVGKTMQVYNTPLYAAPDFDKLSASPRWEPDLCAQVQGEREWLPVISLGDDDHWESGIRANGEVDTDPQTQETGKAVRRAIDALGSTSSAEIDATGFTAEWIEVELAAPGKAPRSMRRQVFDLVGTDLRSQALSDDAPVPVSIGAEAVLSRNLSLLGNTVFLPLVSEVPREFVERLTLFRLWSQRELLLQSGEAENDTDGDSVMETMSQVRPFHARLWTYALAHRTWSPSSANTYLAAPNLIAWHNRMLATSEGELRYQSGFDVIVNQVESQGGAREAFLDRLRQGVADTVAEAALIEDANDPGRTSMDLPGASGALMLLSQPDAVEHELAAWPAELRARVRAELEAGAVVVVPQEHSQDVQPWQLGFWRIDPQDGSCLGIGGQGWGAAVRQDAPSYVSIQVAQIKFMFAVLKTYKCIGASKTRRQGNKCVVHFLCSTVMSVAGLAGIDGRLTAVAGGACSLAGD